MWDHLIKWIDQTNPAGAAILAAAVAVALFALARVIEMIWNWYNRRGLKRRLVVGLFREVRANVICIENFLDASPYPGDLREKVKSDAGFRPLVILQETTQFYDSITASLPEINSDCLIALSKFYDMIREQYAITSSFEGAAFLAISGEGRADIIDALWKRCRRAEKEGWKAMYELELAYPRHWFRHFKS